MGALPDHAYRNYALPGTVHEQNGTWWFQPTVPFLNRIASDPGGLKMLGYKMLKNETGFIVQWHDPVTNEYTENMVRASSMEPTEEIEIAMPYNADMNPMPSQVVGVQACVRQNTLLGDEMGLGKTLQGLLAAKTLELYRTGAGMFRLLIICPAHLRLYWQQECKRILGPSWGATIIMGTKPFTDFPRGGGGSHAYIVGGSTIASQTKVLEMQWDVLIVDEAHEYKNPKSKRTKAVMGIIDTRPIPGGKPIEGGIKARRKLYLTGTPMLNAPIETYPLLATLWPGKWMDYHSFGLYYCGAKRSGMWIRIKDKKTKKVKPKLVYAWDYNPKIRNMNVDKQKEIFSRYRQLYQGLVGCGMVRRKKAQVLQDLPEKDIQVIRFQPQGELVKLCSEEDKMFNRFPDVRKARTKAEKAKTEMEQIEALEELQEAMAKHAKEEVTEREAVGVAKGKYMVNVISEFLDQNPSDKVVVFAHHRAVVEILHDGLKKYKSVKYYGGMKDEAKQRSVREFQEGQSRVFVGNILAAGKGITLTAACKLFFVEMDWVPANMSQCMDRIHRIGQKKKCTIYNYVMAGSLDAHIAEMSMYKREMAELVLEDNVSEDMQFQMDMRMQRQAQKQAKREADLEVEMENAVLFRPKRKLLQMALQHITTLDTSGDKSDGQGWNSHDRKMGLSLSQTRREYSDKQTVIAVRLARKYSRQLPTELKVEIFG